MNATDIMDLIDRNRQGKPPMACCPNCAEPTPLITTLAFRHYEFYCLECGGRYGFLEPHAWTATPELEAHHMRLRAEWEAHAGNKLIVEGVTARSEAAQVEHDAAMAWLKERITR